MNASLAAIATVLLLTSSPWALAVSSVDLTVKGSITPSACTPSLSAGGVIDFGKVPLKDLEYSTITELPQATLELAVNCEAPTLFALRPEDNRPQMNTPRAFGFARHNPQFPLGAYFIDATDFLADGLPVTRMYSVNNGLSWRESTASDPIEPAFLTAFGDRSSGTLAPTPTQNLNVSLLISAFIYPANWMPVNEEIPIDGSATLEVRYL